MPSEIIFRADAYPEIGTGHVMRCLALADACREDGAATCFAGYIADEVLRARIGHNGHGLILLPQDAGNDWLDRVRSRTRWVVLDGYDFSVQDQAEIRNAGPSLLVVDDMAKLDEFVADIVLNQNFHANVEAYHAAGTAKMLMGPRFALLRREFIEHAPRARGMEARRLLVTLGGADPQGACLLIMEAIAKIGSPGLEVLVIAGSSNPHLGRLEAAAQHARIRGHIISVQHYTEDMPGAMTWADIAIIAAGSTSLEVAYMGLPALVLTLADNQEPIGAAMHALGVAESLGWYDVLSANAVAGALESLIKDAPRRIKMSERGKAIVDGQGSRRVAGEMLGTPVRAARMDYVGYGDEH